MLMRALIDELLEQCRDGARRLETLRYHPRLGARLTAKMCPDSACAKKSLG